MMVLKCIVNLNQEMISNITDIWMVVF